MSKLFPTRLFPPSLPPTSHSQLLGIEIEGWKINEWMRKWDKFRNILCKKGKDIEFPVGIYSNFLCIFVESTNER